MCSRFRFADDSRWITDYRQNCIIEQDIMNKLGATSQSDYKAKLQANALQVIQDNEMDSIKVYRDNSGTAHVLLTNGKRTKCTTCENIVIDPRLA